jgi:RNA polymerase sigma-70 factor (ECF subfamily)
MGAVAERRLDENHAAQILVRRCIAGDSAAWEEFVRQYHPRIYQICYRFTGSASEAEDLTQDIFIKMYRSLDSYDASRASFVTWIVTVSRNLLVDHFRKRKYDRVTDSLDVGANGESEEMPLGERIADRGPGPESHLESLEKCELVHRALQRLSPELREAVILRDLQDLDYREIAAVLKVPEGTVKSRINRGRTELARLLARTEKQVS